MVIQLLFPQLGRKNKKFTQCSEGAGNRQEAARRELEGRAREEKRVGTERQEGGQRGGPATESGKRQQKAQGRPGAVEVVGRGVPRGMTACSLPASINPIKVLKIRSHVRL